MCCPTLTHPWKQWCEYANRYYMIGGNKKYNIYIKAPKYITTQKIKYILYTNENIDNRIKVSTTEETNNNNNKKKSI